jgi:hypothetical protein
VGERSRCAWEEEEGVDLSEGVDLRYGEEEKMCPGVREER